MSHELMMALASDPPPTVGMLALCIPIVAIIFGSITAMVRSVIKHRERMAKIGMGIDPDYDPNDPHASM